MPTNLKNTTIVVLTLLMVMSLGGGIAEACPGCSEALPGHVSQGFNTSVLFLMAMPFFVAGSIAFGVLIITRSRKLGLDARLRNESFEETEETES